MNGGSQYKVIKAPNTTKIRIITSYFFLYLAPVTKQSAALSSATQSLNALKFYEKWETGGSLYLPCFERDTLC